MNLEFDLGQVTVTEFGVGRDDGEEQSFLAVPADNSVQAALLEMVKATWNAMQMGNDGPPKYEPSEKHASTEYLYLPLRDAMASAVRELHEATNLRVDSGALAEPDGVFCYFVRLSDRTGRHLTALRRSSQFKGVVKSKGRLVRLWDDTLHIIEDTVFKLDGDFDVLVDSTNVHILHPIAFEFAGRLQQAILDAVPENVKALQRELKFVEFGSIGDYAQKHPRAARCIASIRAQEGTGSIDKALLKNFCKRTGVQVSESKGAIAVTAGHELDFLEVLDRRRYEVSLVKDKPERYRAASRRKIGG